MNDKNLLNDKIAELRNISEDTGVLYVEDNNTLRTNVEQLLGKIFRHVVCAADGAEGYKAFKEHKPRLVITDINMPVMNGIDMAKKIKSEEPDTKIIYITAFDDQQHLLQAIDVGVFRYLSKPAKADQLINALYDAIHAIHYEEDKHLFDSQLKDIFNYQNNLLVMFKDGDPMVVNQRFLDFFGVDTLDDFLAENETMDRILKPHEGFLFSHADRSWFQEACGNPGKLYHTKIMDNEGNSHHLIMKIRQIPHKKESVIASFDDVTELNLLGLYDKNSTDRDNILKNKKSVFTFMKIVDQNHAEIKLHNFYRGLSITNPAVITLIDEDKVVVKTTYPQLKSVKYEKMTTITSDAFPSAVLCKSIKEVDFDKQTIVFGDMEFIEKSCVDRQNIRLEPDDDHHVTLFFWEKKFLGEIRIFDISITSLMLEVNGFPSGVTVGQEVRIAIVLPIPHRAPLTLNTSAKIYRIDGSKHTFRVVLTYELKESMHQGLLEYLANRQMELIREFKAMCIE